MSIITSIPKKFTIPFADNTEEKSINQTLKDRRLIFLFGELTEKRSLSICKQLTYHATVKNCREDVTMFIQSPGGGIDELFSILSIIETVPYKLNIVACGQAFSAAAILLMCGTGVRFAAKHATIMIHSVSMTGMEDKSTAEMTLEAEVMKYFQKKLNKLIVQKTNITRNELKEILLSNLDCYFTPKQSLERGIVDKILTTNELEKILKGT